MTIRELFTKGPLKGVKAVHSSSLASAKGKVCGVDYSIFLYFWCNLDDYAIAATSDPRYDSPLLEQQISQFHDMLSKVFTRIVYVYEGKDLPAKKSTKLERIRKVELAQQKYDSIRAKVNGGQQLSEDELSEAKKLRRAISVPDEIAYGKSINHMRKYGMNMFGAPGEAEHQLVEFQNEGIIDVILTRDADLIPLGAQRVIYDLKLNYAEVEKSTMVLYDRDKTVGEGTEFAEMRDYKDHLPEYASLLGTDYCKRVSGIGPEKCKPFIKRYLECNDDAERDALLLDLEARGVIQAPAKRAKPVRDGYRAASDRTAYIESLSDATKQQITKIDTSFVGWAENFHRAVGMFRHCPVFKISGGGIDISDSDTYDLTLGPLYPLPDGTTWESAIGFDPELLIMGDNLEAKRVSNLECLLRFGGRAPSTFRTPTYSEQENPGVPTTQPLPRYGRINFHTCPVQMQPSNVLLQWLSTRGLHIFTDDRSEIERCVAKARENETEVQEPELQPKENPYHWFDVVKPSPRGNKYDQWNEDWTENLPRLKTIDDTEFTRIFGKGANGIRERALGLLFDGNVMMNGIECINVTSANPNDTSEMILLRTKCAPSMKTNEGKSKKHLFYHVHICVRLGNEDGTDVIRPCPSSACSCINGCFICSHREAVVVGISLMQKYQSIGRLDKIMEYFKAKEDPRLGQGKPTLIENFTLRAPSEHSQAKKKRKREDENADTPARKKGYTVRTVTP